MPDFTLVRLRIAEGVWEGVLTRKQGEAAPALSVTHEGRAVDGVSLTERPESGWTVRVPIPVEAIADGVQTFLVTDTASGQTLDSFSVLAGEALAEDIRAEIDLLRAELDMLKRAFRRHCVETSA